MREILVPEDNNMPLHEAIHIVLTAARDYKEIQDDGGGCEWCTDDGWVDEDNDTAIGIVQRLHDAVIEGNKNG